MLVRDTLASDALVLRAGLRAYMHTTFYYYNDPECQKEFGSLQAFCNYLSYILKTQQGQCAIIGIRLRDNFDLEDGATYMKDYYNDLGSEYKVSGADVQRMCFMSLDARDPTKGHIRGNIRWVIRCLNLVARSIDDQWSTSRIMAYVCP